MGPQGRRIETPLPFISLDRNRQFNVEHRFSEILAGTSRSRLKQKDGEPAIVEAWRAAYSAAPESAPAEE
jgi:hypothetical protein